MIQDNNYVGKLRYFRITEDEDRTFYYQASFSYKKDGYFLTQAVFKQDLHGPFKSKKEGAFDLIDSLAERSIRLNKASLDRILRIVKINNYKELEENEDYRLPKGEQNGK